MYKKITLENGNVVIVNKDIVGHLTSWIDTLNREAEKLPDFGILSALILDTNKNIYFHGGYFSPKTYIPMSFAMGEKYYGQYPGTRQVDVFPMYCCIISKKLIKKIGLPENLGDDIFIDADYCLTAEQAKFRLYSTDKLTVVYQGGAKTPQEIQQYASNFNQQAQTFIAKWGGIISQAYKYPVLYTAKASGTSGFAIAARNYIHAMSDNGIDVNFEPLDTIKDAVPPCEDEKINSILQGNGDMFMPQITWGQAPWAIRNSGIYKILHAEFEADDLPEIWVRYCNMMDEVWVPTEWDKKKFEKAGVHVPIYIIYQGIDPNYYHPNYAPMENPAKESFKFICNAAWFPRKNLRNLLLAFQSEFKKGEDVCLILKTLDLGLNDGIDKELEKLPKMEQSANVYVKNEDFKDHEMPSFYTMGDCFVLPTHGEGWGLPIFEALACGLPIITTGYSAPFEILKDKDGKTLPGVHFIDCDKSISDEKYIYTEGATWAEPNLQHLKKLMREVFDNRIKEKEAALKTSEFIRKEYSWFNVSQKIKERIVDIYENKLKGNK